jgi:hypothetical protein
MTTLAQGELPRDSGILRTVARHNRIAGFSAFACVGLYADVIQDGLIARHNRMTVS